jgi:hypothetical protein
MSDNNVGYYNAPFALDAGYVNSASFNQAPMFPAQFPTESGITVYPTFSGSNAPEKQMSMTGTEAAVVPYRIPVDRAALLVAHEALFSFPEPRDVGLYQAPSLKDGGITTYSMLNLKLQQDWNEILRLAAGPNEPLNNFAREYLAKGECFFQEDGRDPIYGWSRFAKVMRDPKYAMFRMACNYGLARVNFLGITKTDRDVNARMPLGMCSVTVAGTAKLRNYWGSEPTLGTVLGFVFVKKPKGPYQIVPWCAKQDSMPPPSLCSYKDSADRLHTSRIIRVARMTHPNPDHGMLDISTIASGLSTSIQDLTELSSKLSHLDCLNISLLTSARYFI